MKNKTVKKYQLRTQGFCTNATLSLVLLLLLSCLQGFAQKSPKVTTEIDTNFISIGDQLTWKVTAAVGLKDQVIFPEGQTFSPLEMVRSFATDTTKNENQILLEKRYALTQFDPGSYKLPIQRIEINGKGYFTDSLLIKVTSIPVDTTVQKLYDIKPLIAVNESAPTYWKYFFIGLLFLLVVGGLIYWFVIREKPLTEEEKVALLPPYDRALLELKRLENSKYLIKDEFKEYYSELTGIVRSYLEEDAHVSALESTTDQLITKLELLRDSGKLSLDKDTIDKFKSILQTADLVKFAKSKPAMATAEKDRLVVTQIVEKTHEAIPEPTPEELMQEAAYQEKIKDHNKKRRIALGATTVIGLFLVGLIIAGSQLGFTNLKDTILRHPIKELLEQEWITSAYGFPPISIATPEVLARDKKSNPAEGTSTILNFDYVNEDALFTIRVQTATFSKDATPDFKETLELIITGFEAKGVKNIITKQEEYTTPSGTKGIRVFGTAKFRNPNSKKLLKGAYTIVLFGGEGFQQYVILTWEADDVYAKQIINKVLRSIEVKSEI